jgi:hypothetical protein
VTRISVAVRSLGSSSRSVAHIRPTIPTPGREAQAPETQ